MAVTVIEKTGGTSSSAAGVTVSFPSAVDGDLILFVYATQQNIFHDDQWYPNTGWQGSWAFFSTLLSYNGFYFHVVESSETSWTPVNESDVDIPGVWTAYRIQGHAAANPVLNYYTFQDNGTNFPSTVPGSDQARGMFFSTAVVLNGHSVTLSGGVTGGASWHIDSQNDGSGNNLATAYVQAPDNITTATGTWGSQSGVSNIQWVVQAAPVGPSGPDASYIIKEEVVLSEFNAVSHPDIGFDISWTPTPGNTLFAIFLASTFFPSADLTPQAGWTIQKNSNQITSGGGMVVATRDVQGGDSTHYVVSTTGAPDNAYYYAYVFEIAGTAYSGSALADGIASPFYPTPFEGGTGQTLCFFPVTIGTGQGNVYSQYAMTSGQTPDGSAVWSLNQAGISSKFVSVVSHAITVGGGTADTGVSATTNDGLGVTAVFNILSSPCVITDPLNFTGDVSGHFYTMQGMGSEVVPCLYEDAVITIDNGTMSPAGQTIATDGEWIRWLPNSGPLSIPFSPRTLWVVTNQAKNTPPVVAVWASTQVFPIWKQTCTVS